MTPWTALCIGALSVVIGLYVVRRGQRRIGWLLVAHGVSFASLMASPGPNSGHVGLVIDQLAAGTWVFLFLWLVLIAYLAPDGRPLTPRWWRWMQLGLAGVVAFLVGAAGDQDGFHETHPDADLPVRWLPDWLAATLGVAGLLLTAAFIFGAVLAVRTRLARVDGDPRLQLLWLVWGATSVPAGLVLTWAGYLLDRGPLVADVGIALAGLGLPVAIGIAIVRHRLFDIELVLSRTLTYGALLVGVVVLYGGLLLAADAWLGQGTVGGLLAVGIVVVAVQPAYAWLRRRIERAVYGYRSDPAAALRNLGADVESADPLRVVETITASVAAALKVEAVWVEPPGGSDADDRLAIRVPLVHRREHMGNLAVRVPPGRPLSAADRALLHDLARQAAVTVRAAQLATELQASRSSIVAAREEERKRLRRDLHDGLGPSLAGILLTLQAARARDDDRERDALLDEVRDETRAAIGEVRRVVDDLRPPALDEVGLLGAVRHRAASLTSPQLTYEVKGPPLPPLPAAVEVAAFRIASEAMANVSRHSGATRCRVTVELAGSLVLRVSDNGVGAPERPVPGVGWLSMKERASELGGSCSIASRPEGGLEVTAVLPLAGAPTADRMPVQVAP